MGCREYYKHNTQLEKILLFAVAVLSFIVVVLFISFLSTAHESDVCNTPECVRAATHILDSVNPSVDPCDDFYNFSCGMFLKNAYAKGQPSTLHRLEEIMKNKLKEIVAESNDRNASKSLRLQRKFYRACINETAIEADNDITLLRLLDEFIGGWPVVKSYWVYSESDFDISKNMIKARQMGFFYQFYFRVDTFVAKKKYIWIRPPSERDISSFQWHKNNIDIINAIAEDLGSRNPSANNDLMRAMEFAEELEKLANIYGNETGKPDLNKTVRIKGINHKYIKIEWLDFLSHITGLQLNEGDLVIFDVNDYLRELYHLLLKTSKKAQANYMAWAIISTNVNSMTKKIRDKYRTLKKSPNATSTSLTRSDLCYTLSADLFKYVAESEYIRRYTPLSTREYIRDMVSNIKHELKTFLQKSHWTDDIINRTTEQMKRITEAVGWIDIVYDAKKFEMLFDYHQLHTDSTNLVEMSREVVTVAINRYYKGLERNGTQLAQVYANTPKLAANAYFIKDFNKIIIPTTILREPIFDENRPHYMNYGSLGSIIGHEILLGIINYSDQTDSNEESLYISLKSKPSAIQCLLDENNSMEINLLKMNDFNKNVSSMFVEKLADLVGVDLAYAAYRKWVTDNSNECLLPGIKYTPNQLFWIMTSSYLCYEPRLADKSNSNMKEPTYATPSFRVLARLRSSPHFAQDFICPVGSRMNPEKKCRVVD